METVKDTGIVWAGWLLCGALAVGAWAAVSNPPLPTRCEQQLQRLQQIDDIEDQRVMLSFEYRERSGIENYLHDHCRPAVK